MFFHALAIEHIVIFRSYVQLLESLESVCSANLQTTLMLWTHRPNFHWELTVTPQSGLIGIIDVNNPQYSLIMPYSCLIRFSNINVLAVDKGSLKDI